MEEIFIIDEETIYYGADQSVSRNSLIAGIFADGTYTKPLIVIDRKTIEEELIVQGYNESIIAFKFKSNGFIDTQISNDWADEILFHEFEKRREISNYKDGAIVILHVRPEKNLSSQSKQIIKILKSWFTVAATPSNINSVYKQAGFVPNMEDDSL